MASWEQIRNAMPGALGDQGYRPVAVNAIPDASVQFPASGDTELDSALVGLTQTPNWGQVAAQMRQFARLNGFAGAFVRRDRFDLEVVVVQGLVGPSNGPLTLAGAQHELDEVWTIHKRLSDYVGQFHLHDDTKAAAQAVVDRLGTVVAPAPATPAPAAAPAAPAVATPAPAAGTPAPAAPGAPDGAPASDGWDIDVAQIQAAGGGADDGSISAARYQLLVAAAKLALHLAIDAVDAQVATGNLVLVGANGLAPDLVDKLESIWGLGHQDNSLTFKALKTTLWTTGVDAPQLQAHGHTATASLDVGALGRSLGY